MRILAFLTDPAPIHALIHPKWRLHFLSLTILDHRKPLGCEVGGWTIRHYLGRAVAAQARRSIASSAIVVLADAVAERIAGATLTAHVDAVPGTALARGTGRASHRVSGRFRRYPHRPYRLRGRAMFEAPLLIIASRKGTEA